MEFLSELWMPIVLSGVFVFVVSSVLHMVIPIHKGDYKKMPGEDKIVEVMRAQGLGRGAYMFPCPSSMKDMGSPEMMEKYKAGPVGFMTTLDPGPPAMGKSLLLWLIYSMAVGLFVGYLTSHAVQPGADYLHVFRISGTVAFVAYSLNYVVDSIWKGVPWMVTAKFMFDGLIYALVTAGTFAWQWPEAA